MPPEHMRDCAYFVTDDYWLGPGLDGDSELALSCLDLA